MDNDQLWPRDNPDYRYRVYAVIGGQQNVLAAAPDMAGVGLAIGTLHEDAKQAGRRLADEGRIGVLDVAPDGEPSAKGEWIVMPFDRRTP